MCVIIAKLAGQQLPPKNELRRAFAQNPDGCGFASKTMSYHSMDFEDFYQHLVKVPKSEACIIHFRWATHGSVKLENTHPFYDSETGVYFAHNGVLDLCPTKDMTDSEFAFRRVIAPAIKYGGYKSAAMKRAVESVRGGSRFAFIKDGNLSLFGNFTKIGGCLYSNTRHLQTPRYWHEFYVA